jgi:drug/metabolite transporter (DMT)-like permease
VPPNDERLPIDAFATGAMVLLCCLWGVQQVAIKITARDVGPVMQATLRSGLSALCVAAFVLWRRYAASFRRGTWRAGILAGGLFGVEFLFIAEALRLTSASHASVFLYTAPVFAALGLHLLLPLERLRPLQWAGIAIAFCGIAVTFAGGLAATALDSRTLGGDLLAVLGGIAWGATTVTIRASSLSNAPASQTLLYQLAIGFIVQLGYATLTGQAGQVTSTALAWGSLAFQAVVISFLSYLAWFWLLRRYLATRLSVFCLLTPVFGVAAGVLVLGDPVDVWFGFGATLVLLGIAVVSGGYLLQPDRSQATG